jgi:hypothetical protein
MSYFVDMSEGHPSATAIASEMRKRNYETSKSRGFDLKTEEENIIASIIGLKPSGICQLDGGCTLDKGVEMGICHLAGIPTVAVFEDADMKKETFSTLKTKLESKKVLVSPLGREIACCSFLQDVISSLRDFYIKNKLSEREFNERRVFREGVYNLLAGKWDEFLFGSKVPEGLLKKT